MYLYTCIYTMEIAEYCTSPIYLYMQCCRLCWRWYDPTTCTIYTLPCLLCNIMRGKLFSCQVVLWLQWGIELWVEFDLGDGVNKRSINGHLRTHGHGYVIGSTAILVYIQCSICVSLSIPSSLIPWLISCLVSTVCTDMHMHYGYTSQHLSHGCSIIGMM